MSSKRAMKQAQKQAYAKHRSNITSTLQIEAGRLLYIVSMTAGALVRHRACIVPLWLVSGSWCSVIATPVT